MVVDSSADRLGLNPSLYAPAFMYQMSFNFSKKENSTVLETTPSCTPWTLEDSTPSPTNPPTAAAAYQLSTGAVAALGLLFTLLWLISLLGNALVCLVIHRSRRTQSTTNYFVVSMACADLLMSLGCAPFIFLQVASGRWPLSAAACKLVRYTQHLCLGVQVYVLLSISVDRFYTIVYPLSFKVSREKAKKMILASWFFDAAFVSPCLFFYGSSSSGGHCDFFLPGSWSGFCYAAVHLLVGFTVPLSFIVFFYLRVVRYIWRISDDHTVRRTMNIVPRTKVKTIKMFLMLNSVSFLTWMPFFMAQVWHPLVFDDSDREGVLFFVAVTGLCFSSTASKPTLYSVYNANFRRGMRETFCMSSMKCYRSNAYTITASSRMAKKNYVGVVDMPVQGSKTDAKDNVYDAFDRDGKDKKVAWPTNSNPSNTFV